MQSFSCQVLANVNKLYLHKLRSESDSYQLFVTDLGGNVWQERLEKKQIITRAKQVNCVIDLSSTTNPESQFQLFYTKLHQALSVSDQATKIELSIVQDKIVVHVRLPVPPIPDPLMWTFNLSPCQADQQSQVNLDLCLGLIGINSVLLQKINELTELLKRKDYHLNALIERVESASRPYNDPRRFKDAVAPFDKDKWWNKVSNGKPLDIKGLSETLNEVKKFWPSDENPTPPPIPLSEIQENSQLTQSFTIQSTEHSQDQPQSDKQVADSASQLKRRQDLQEQLARQQSKRKKARRF
jgi:hypothetical protein